jgi:hypothetical protein
LQRICDELQQVVTHCNAAQRVCGGRLLCSHLSL